MTSAQHWFNIALVLSVLGVAAVRGADKASRRRTCQQTRHIYQMFYQCWFNVVDDWPTLGEHWVDVSCLLGCQLRAMREAPGSDVRYPRRTPARGLPLGDGVAWPGHPLMIRQPEPIQKTPVCSDVAFSHVHRMHAMYKGFTY